MRRERLRRAKTVAVRCQRLRPRFHGKEEAVGSSPTEGFENPLQTTGFFRVLLRIWACRRPTHVALAQRGAPLRLTRSLASRGLSCARRAPLKAAGTADPVAEPAERVCTAPALPAGRVRIYASAGPRLTQRRFRLWLLHPGETAASPSRA